jgi:hypothetical protein
MPQLFTVFKSNASLKRKVCDVSAAILSSFNIAPDPILIHHCFDNLQRGRLSFRENSPRFPESLHSLPIVRLFDCSIERM